MMMPTSLHENGSTINPQPMISRIDSLLDQSEIDDFLQSLRLRPLKSLRCRVDRIEETLPFETQIVDWYPSFGRLVTDNSIRPGAFLSYATADYYIQDSASMLPLQLLELQENDWVCDLCAAPGGKATAISELLGTQGLLLANEAIAGRTDVLRYSLARTGRANTIQTHLDPAVLASKLLGRFDKVLVDVPCSGQSLLGRDQQAQSAFSDKHVQHCAARAQRILRNAMAMVRPGGRLIFSTCTFSIEENEDQVRWMLEQFPGLWAPATIPSLTPWQSKIHEGCWRLWPHRDNCSGGFAAALQSSENWDPELAFEGIHNDTPSYSQQRSSPPQRSSSQPGHHKPNKASSTHRSLHKNQATSKKDLDITKQIEEHFGRCTLQLQPLHLSHSSKTSNETKIIGLEPGAAEFATEFPELGLGSVLCAYKSFGRSGATTNRSGAVNSGQAEPYHALAMLQDRFFAPHAIANLEDPQAVRFVQGQAIEGTPSQQIQAGWAVAQWHNKPLGWLKGVAGNKESPGRWNNHLPPWARMNSTE